jgi:hypothetical protein
MKMLLRNILCFYMCCSRQRRIYFALTGTLERRGTLTLSTGEGEGVGEENPRLGFSSPKI